MPVRLHPKDPRQRTDNTSVSYAMQLTANGSNDCRNWMEGDAAEEIKGVALKCILCKSLLLNADTFRQARTLLMFLWLVATLPAVPRP